MGLFRHIVSFAAGAFAGRRFRSPSVGDPAPGSVRPPGSAAKAQRAEGFASAERSPHSDMPASGDRPPVPEGPSAGDRATAVESDSAQTERKSRLRRWTVRAAIAVPALALLGFLVAASGIIPIKASSGHWAITEWLLSFSMSRSVATHSTGIKAPALDDPALVLKGAGHYESGCMPCHGSPRMKYPRVTHAMTPPPPALPEEMGDWDPEELFYIVKHGIKFTGMPAWPSLERDDEVWAMVAFLQELPAMDAETYGRLVEGEAAGAELVPAVGDSVDVPPLSGLVQPGGIPPSVTASCGRCHGIDGRGRGLGAFPRLAGQRPNYVYAALQAYASDRRHSGIMKPIAAAMTRDEMRDVALFYAALSPAPSANADTTDAAAVARGARIAEEGIPREGIPSCMDCHGPQPTRRNPFYPNLAGQYADYIVLQLHLFQKDQRGGSRFAHLMHPTAERLTEEQIRDVAAFYAAIGGE